MSAGKPLWRSAVEAADNVAAPLIEGATKHESFRVGYSALKRAQRAVQQRSEWASRQVWHRMNLPTASDVNRLLTQITAVENRVRTLSRQLEDQPSPTAAAKAPPAKAPPAKAPPAKAPPADAPPKPRRGGGPTK